MLSAFMLSSCSSKEEPQVENNDEYYVKYEFSMTSRYILENTITFTTEKGAQSVIIKGKTQSWIATYGPLKKGTKVILNTICNNNLSATSNARIYVSKNKDPFVIKAEDSGNHSFDLSYTIDF